MGSRLRAGGAVEAFEDVGQFFGGDTGSGVADGEHHVFAGGFEFDVNLSLQGVLECVGEKIEDDFFPHIAVNVDRLRQRMAVDSEAHAGAFNGGAEDAGKI
jgi:hypothetical protein